MTSTIHLTTGLPASGKSTFALRLVEESEGRVRRVNLDDLRRMMDRHDGSFRTDHEETVLKIQDAAILAAVDDGFDVVIDNTHMTSRLPRRYKNLLAGRDATFVVHSFTHVPIEECIRRDAVRRASVGEEVIRGMAQRAKRSRCLTADQLNDRPIFAPYQPDYTLPPAIICDIDGTLADNSGRGPHAYDLCETDLLHEDVARLVRLCHAAGDRIVLMSGRPDSVAEDTKRWLDKHSVPYHALWMRRAGDVRPDDIVKGELFDAHVRNTYAVHLVLDDRDRVVRLWRRLGLRCLQVDYGDF